MRADECLFLGGKSGRAADIAAMTDFDPTATWGGSRLLQRKTHRSFLR
jgi:hypothetical protein